MSQGSEETLKLCHMASSGRIKWQAFNQNGKKINWGMISVQIFERLEKLLNLIRVPPKGSGRNRKQF